MADFPEKRIKMTESRRNRRKFSGFKDESVSREQHVGMPPRSIPGGPRQTAEVFVFLWSNQILRSLPNFLRNYLSSSESSCDER